MTEEGKHDDLYQQWLADRIKESEAELAQMNANYEAGLGVSRHRSGETS